MYSYCHITLQNDQNFTSFQFVSKYVFEQNEIRPSTTEKKSFNIEPRTSLERTTISNELEFNTNGIPLQTELPSAKPEQKLESLEKGTVAMDWLNHLSLTQRRIL